MCFYIQGPRGKILQATARIPHQTTWFVQRESGFSDMRDNKLRLNVNFNDIVELGKDFLQWMRCGQQVEANGVENLSNHSGIFSLLLSF